MKRQSVELARADVPGTVFPLGRDWRQSVVGRWGLAAGTREYTLGASTVVRELGRHTLRAAWLPMARPRRSLRGGVAPQGQARHVRALQWLAMWWCAVLARRARGRHADLTRGALETPSWGPARVVFVLSRPLWVGDRLKREEARQRLISPNLVAHRDGHCGPFWNCLFFPCSGLGTSPPPPAMHAHSVVARVRPRRQGASSIGCRTPCGAAQAAKVKRRPADLGWADVRGSSNRLVGAVVIPGSASIV